MFKKQNGFAALELLLVLLTMVVVAGAGFYVYHTRISESKIINKQGAFLVLKQASDAKLASSQKECPSYEQSCPGIHLANRDKFSIAKAYGITTDPEDTLHFGLQKGNSLDIGGGGARYLSNKSKLGISATSWYWEIGACSTNKRIFIDATTGATAGVHDYTYCTHVDELSAPN